MERNGGRGFGGNRKNQIERVRMAVKMHLEVENERLQRENQQLQMELSRLRQAGNDEVIVVRKTVIPKDYEVNKKRMAALEEEIENLKYILSYSGIQSLDSMIEDLENDLRVKMKRIVDEFHNFPVGAVERKLMQHTMQNFREHIKTLETLLK